MPSADSTPFEQDHRSYGWMKRVIKDVRDPMDAVVIVEQERPGCTSTITEDVAYFYRKVAEKDEWLKLAGVTNDNFSLRTVHYVDIVEAAITFEPLDS